MIDLSPQPVEIQLNCGTLYALISVHLRLIHDGLIVGHLSPIHVCVVTQTFRVVRHIPVLMLIKL